MILPEGAEEVYWRFDWSAFPHECTPLARPPLRSAHGRGGAPHSANSASVGPLLLLLRVPESLSPWSASRSDLRPQAVFTGQGWRKETIDQTRMPSAAMPALVLTRSFGFSLIPFSSLHPRLTLVKNLGTVQPGLGHLSGSQLSCLQVPLSPCISEWTLKMIHPLSCSPPPPPYSLSAPPSRPPPFPCFDSLLPPPSLPPLLPYPLPPSPIRTFVTAFRAHLAYPG